MPSDAGDPFMHKLRSDMSDQASQAHDGRPSTPPPARRSGCCFGFAEAGVEDYLEDHGNLHAGQRAGVCRKTSRTSRSRSQQARSRLRLRTRLAAVAMRKAGARHVVGVDILDERLAHGEALARRGRSRITSSFIGCFPRDLHGKFSMSTCRGARSSTSAIPPRSYRP